MNLLDSSDSVLGHVRNLTVVAVVRVSGNKHAQKALRCSVFQNRIETLPAEVVSLLTDDESTHGFSGLPILV